MDSSTKFSILIAKHYQMCSAPFSATCKMLQAPQHKQIFVIKMKTELWSEATNKDWIFWWYLQVHEYLHNRTWYNKSNYIISLRINLTFWWYQYLTLLKLTPNCWKSSYDFGVFCPNFAIFAMCLKLQTIHISRLTNLNWIEQYKWFCHSTHVWLLRY